MKIGIIGAMDEETRALKEKMENIESWTRAGVFFHSGAIGKHEVILVQSGIGKVQSAMTATLLIHHYGVQAIVNTGSAGGIGDGLNVGDVVISSQLAYFDVDVTGFGYAMGQLPQQPLYFEVSKYLLINMERAAKEVGQYTQTGLIVSGDSFVNSSEKTKEIKDYFPNALACEMEGASIAQVAHQFNVAFLAVRALSDTADAYATQSFDEFIIDAGRRSAKMVFKFLEIIK